MTNEEILKEKLSKKMSQARYYKNKKEELEEIIKAVEEYVEKMSYAPVVDNPKKDLVKILKRVDKE